jgi:hypothetical protein
MHGEARLSQFESKVRPSNTTPQHHVDLDQCVLRLGLVPSAVRVVDLWQGRQSGRSNHEILGIELREFKRELEDAANVLR